MLAFKTIVLDQINNVLKKKWQQNDLPICENNSIHTPEKTNISGERNPYLSKSKELFEKFEKEIILLEEQNDQLFYFIYYLFENFPDLLTEILPQEGIPRKLEDHETKEIKHGDPLNGKSMSEKDRPCPTRREWEVLALLQKGYCAKEIARILFISETTVITHKKNLKEKFYAKNTAELISKACTCLSGNNKP